MRYLALAVCLGAVACSGTTTAPTVDDRLVTGVDLSGGTVSGDPATIQGGKACVLTPADPVDVPICRYTCPNGVTFELPNPGDGCSRVAPQPKKK